MKDLQNQRTNVISEVYSIEVDEIGGFVVETNLDGSLFEGERVNLYITAEILHDSSNDSSD